MHLDLAAASWLSFSADNEGKNDSGAPLPPPSTRFPGDKEVGASSKRSLGSDWER